MVWMVVDIKKDCYMTSFIIFFFYNAVCLLSFYLSSFPVFVLLVTGVCWVSSVAPHTIIISPSFITFSF